MSAKYVERSVDCTRARSRLEPECSERDGHTMEDEGKYEGRKRPPEDYELRMEIVWATTSPTLVLCVTRRKLRCELCVGFYVGDREAAESICSC